MAGVWAPWTALVLLVLPEMAGAVSSPTTGGRSEVGPTRPGATDHGQRGRAAGRPQFGCGGH